MASLGWEDLISPPEIFTGDNLKLVVFSSGAATGTKDPLPRARDLYFRDFLLSQNSFLKTSAWYKWNWQD